MSPALAGGFFTTEPPGKPYLLCRHKYRKVGKTRRQKNMFQRKKDRTPEEDLREA